MSAWRLAGVDWRVLIVSRVAAAVLSAMIQDSQTDGRKTTRYEAVSRCLQGMHYNDVQLKGAFQVTGKRNLVSSPG